MKSKANQSSSQTAAFPPLTSQPNSLRHHFGFWSLDFAGQRAVFDHEQGAYYVGYLLLNPPAEPVHAMRLELQADMYFKLPPPKEPCETLIKHPTTGITEALRWDALVERGFYSDEPEGLERLRWKIEELEAILQDDYATEPVKAEVQRELEEIYDYQKRRSSEARITSTAQKTVRSVRMAIRRFHAHLAAAVNADRNPHPVLRPFADYIKTNIIIPSARYSMRGGHGCARKGVTGCFTHEPPPGVIWRD